MKKPFITVLLSIAIAAAVHAQDDFILKKSGEKLAGEVYQPLNLLREVQFRANKNEKFQTYTAGDLNGYQFKQNYFATCEIQAEDGSVFLLTLVNGAANLYSIPARDAFYVEKNGDYRLLEKKNRMVDGKEMEDRRYMGILKALFADCALPEKLFEQLKFSAQSLANATQQYNTCRDPQAVYEKPKKKMNPIQLGISGGSGFTEANPANIFFYNFENIGFSNKNTVSLEVLLSNPVLPSLYFRPGVGYIIKEGGIESTFSLDDVIYTTKISYIQLPVRLSYFLPSKKFSPFISLGGLFSLPITEEERQVTIHRMTGNTVSDVKLDLEESKEAGYVAGVGFQLNFLGRIKPFIEYQFEKTRMTKERWSFTTHKAMLGIRF